MTVFMKNSILDTANTKSVCIRSYSGLYFLHSDRKRRDIPYLSVFNPNARKYGPE